MSSRLTENQIDDLLIYCGTEPQYWKDNDCLVCCPVHNEHNPSMGVSSEKQICHCFSCGFAGDFAKLLAYSKPEEFGLDMSTPECKKKTEFKAYRRAKEFLALRYELEYRELGKRVRSIKRYGQTRNIYLKDDERVTLPLYKF